MRTRPGRTSSDSGVHPDGLCHLFISLLGLTLSLDRGSLSQAEAVSSAWGQVYTLTGSNKAIFLPQLRPGRSALGADQQFGFTWMTWNNPDSFKAEGKNVPSTSKGRPQRFVYSSHG